MRKTGPKVKKKKINKLPLASLKELIEDMEARKQQNSDVYLAAKAQLAVKDKK